MLHVEMWEGHRTSSGNWYEGAPAPAALLSPVQYLIEAACPPRPQR
jgi:hypothetical protein